jgi:hypothetical protein
VLASTAAVVFVILMLRVADQLAKTKVDGRAEHQQGVPTKPDHRDEDARIYGSL